jgi:iron(III) transport system substrate-binding protein
MTACPPGRGNATRLPSPGTGGERHLPARGFFSSLHAEPHSANDDGGWSLMGRSLIIAALVGAMAAGSMGAPARADDQAVYQAARKEGRLVYWGSPDVKTARALSEGFAQLYPGIEVELFKIQPAPAIERIITAANAGRHEVDLVDSQLGYVELLLNRGMLESYAWETNLGIDPERILHDGKAIVGWHLDTPLAYNSMLVRPGMLMSWDDPLAASWHGKLIVEARGFMFAVLALAWGEEKAFDYLRKVMANRPILTKGGTSTIEALAGGQGAIAYGAYGGILQQYADQGAPVDWARLGPIPAQVAVLLPLKAAPHPNAARLWVKFFTSPDGQRILYENQGLDTVRGRDMGPIGKRYREAGLDVVMESSDAASMRALVGKAAAIIGALQ